MKLGKMVEFESRRWPGVAASTSLPAPAQSGRDKPDHEGEDELLAENPLFLRAVDVVHGTQEVADAFDFHHHPAMKVLSVGVAVGAATWGAEKVINGHSALDRIEGISHLALAGEACLHIAGSDGVAHEALGIIHGLGEIIVGGSDIVRGHQEHDTRRLLTGATLTTVGVAACAGVLVPSLSPLSSSVLLAATLGRQAILGSEKER